MRSQFVLDLNRELIVVNFAGGGGFCTGIFNATGRHVDIAINHDLDALGMHGINHPQTLHLREDVWQVDPRKVTKGRPVGLAEFSPDCTDHSKAKGGKPRSKKIRGLAWVMLKWDGTVKQRVGILENVEEFQDWGPLVALRCKHTGRVRKVEGSGGEWCAECKSHIAAKGETVPIRDQQLTRDNRKRDRHGVIKGRIFRRFVKLLRQNGNTVEWRERRACDSGAGTIRKRFFLITRRDGQPIVWPEPTHGPANSEAVRKKLRKPYVVAADSIDWSIPCPSIFLSKAEAKKLRVKRPLETASNRRIAKGVKRFVMDAEEPFLVNLTHQGGDRIESVSEPMRTVTGAHGGEKAVVVPHVTKFRTGSVGSAVTEPTPTATAGPSKDPAGAAHALGVVEASVASAPFITEHANASSDRNMPADSSLRTQCAEVKGGHFAVVSPLLAGVGGRAGQSEERPVTAPGGTTTTKGDTAVIAAHVARQFGTGVGSAADKPIGTTMTDGGGKSQFVATFLAQNNTGVVGHAMTEPVSTLTGTCSHQALIAASLFQYYGTDQAPKMNGPAPTGTTKDRTSLQECTLLIPPLTEELAARARIVAAFLRENGIEFEGEFATTRSGLVIYDIGLRMLQPRELFNAQGFPRSYVIDQAYVLGDDGQWLRDEDGNLLKKKLPKHAQVQKCGNSVCPPEAEALTAANCPELIIWEEGERAA